MGVGGYAYHITADHTLSVSGTASITSTPLGITLFIKGEKNINQTKTYQITAGYGISWTYNYTTNHIVTMNGHAPSISTTNLQLNIIKAQNSINVTVGQPPSSTLNSYQFIHNPTLSAGTFNISLTPTDIYTPTQTVQYGIVDSSAISDASIIYACETGNCSYQNGYNYGWQLFSDGNLMKYGQTQTKTLTFTPGTGGTTQTIPIDVKFTPQNNTSLKDIKKYAGVLNGKIDLQITLP